MQTTYDPTICAAYIEVSETRVSEHCKSIEQEEEGRTVGRNSEFRISHALKSYKLIMSKYYFKMLMDILLVIIKTDK